MIPVQNYTKTLQDRGEWSSLARNMGAAERVISVGAGVALVGLAGALRTPLSIGGAILGAADRPRPQRELRSTPPRSQHRDERAQGEPNVAEDLRHELAPLRVGERCRSALHSSG